MNNLAIHQALRLEQYPEEMAWLCFPDSELPEGTTELLRLCTSKNKLEEFAKDHDLEKETLHKALMNFVEKAVVIEGNSNEKILATKKLTNNSLTNKIKSEETIKAALSAFNENLPPRYKFKPKCNTLLKPILKKSPKTSEATEPNPIRKAAISNAVDISDANLQAMLSKLENAYEDGRVDIIKPILANAPEIKGQTDQQINDKLETLFEITNQRKMVLFNFDWSNISGQIQGKGKFLSRYHLEGEEKWLTREGTATITVIQDGRKLTVNQLELENQSIAQ
ncbi:hypothetical protein GQR58_006685 [Nymphon striatum]|nr:hypothetical protein GQR58_006685 [Nymphon striatum]